MMSILLSAATLVTLAGTASAETVKGRVKAIAGELRLFSLMAGQEKGQLISWNDKTAWKGINNAAGLKLDELLSVDISPGNDFPIATTVFRGRTPLPDGIRITSLEQLTVGLDEKESNSSVTLVDTRAVAQYDAGHIPGAVSLPLARLEKRTIGLLPENKAARLVFYDDGQGGESAGRAAEIAGKAGYTDAAILPEGATGWVESGKFLAASTHFIRKTNPVVIDLRTAEQVSRGHIAKAVNYPAATLTDNLTNLPANKLTPLVLYGNSDKDAVAAAQTLRKHGYRRVMFYPGGTDSWLKNAEVLKTGPAGQVIDTAATHGGMLLPKDFEMALLSPVMVEIVDVRSATDHKKGNFPNAKNIPLQELGKRHGELDRNKIQVVFAADPVQAEMAYDFLYSKEYRVNYLNGSIQFAKDGTYVVKEK